MQARACSLAAHAGALSGAFFGTRELHPAALPGLRARPAASWLVAPMSDQTRRADRSLSAHMALRLVNCPILDSARGSWVRLRRLSFPRPVTLRAGNRRKRQPIWARTTHFSPRSPSPAGPAGVAAIGKARSTREEGSIQGHLGELQSCRRQRGLGKAVRLAMMYRPSSRQAKVGRDPSEYHLIGSNLTRCHPGGRRPSSQGRPFPIILRGAVSHTKMKAARGRLGRNAEGCLSANVDLRGKLAAQSFPVATGPGPVKTLSMHGLSLPERGGIDEVAFRRRIASRRRGGRNSFDDWSRRAILFRPRWRGSSIAGTPRISGFMGFDRQRPVRPLSPSPIRQRYIGAISTASIEPAAGA